MKALPNKKTPAILRNFANEISLFCRRMSDLGIEKENYSCIILQDVFQRLDTDTSLRYRSKIELKRELLLESSGSTSTVEADLDSLCKFIRSEATTLELSSTNNTQTEHLKSVNVDQCCTSYLFRKILLSRNLLLETLLVRVEHILHHEHVVALVLENRNNAKKYGS